MRSAPPPRPHTTSSRASLERRLSNVSNLLDGAVPRLEEEYGSRSTNRSVHHIHLGIALRHVSFTSRLFTGACALTIALTFGSSHAGSAARAVALPTDPLTAVITAGSWAAWRINVPVAGFVDFTILGANTGNAFVAFVDGGGGGGGYPVVQAAVGQAGFHEGVAIEGGDTGAAVAPGIHWAVAIVGGGTVPAGLATVKITAPAGTAVLGFNSGPALDLTDANFASGGDVVVGTPVVTNESIHGSVQANFQHGLFGWFYAFPGGAHISYDDPFGVNHSTEVEEFAWFNATAGSYVFHADATVPFGPDPASGAHIRAVLADVQLP